eukprot:6196558-Pleurochrysis_carterae.AAC.1
MRREERRDRVQKARQVGVTEKTASRTKLIKNIVILVGHSARPRARNDGIERGNREARSARKAKRAREQGGPIEIRIARLFSRLFLVGGRDDLRVAQDGAVPRGLDGELIHGDEIVGVGRAQLLASEPLLINNGEKGVGRDGGGGSALAQDGL